MQSRSFWINNSGTAFDGTQYVRKIKSIAFKVLSKVFANVPKNEQNKLNNNESVD